MKRVIKWKSKDGVVSSQDGYITIYQDNQHWIMSDKIDGDRVVCNTKQDALDQGANRMMITEMGNFNVFLKMLETNGDLSKISDWIGNLSWVDMSEDYLI